MPKAISRKPEDFPRYTPEKDAATIAAEQGVQPVEDPETLMGDFWPEEEDIEEFLAAVERWRHGKL